MAAGDPIKLGSATSGLIPMTSSRITTDDYGVQKGTVTYLIGDQSLAQSSRFNLGSTYSGSLPQFAGFKVNRSGDITGLEGKAAQIEVEYVVIDPLWVIIPLDSADLEIKLVKMADTVGIGVLYDSILTVTIPILHPTVSYKYPSATAKSDLGTYGTPTGAPILAAEKIFHFQSWTFDNPTLDLEQKILKGTTTILTINTDGTCTKTNTNYQATVTGLFATGSPGLINPVDFHFKPDPQGWLCIKQDQKPLAAGAIYEIDETWKTQYVFSGTSQGTWWSGAHVIHCS